MGALGNFTNALLDAANTTSNVYEDYITKQATLSTQTKNIQLQTDIESQLRRLRQSSPDDFEQWNTDINNFFEQIKSGMSNKDSPYFCQNNLQAEQFTKILEQNQVNVSSQVSRLAEQQQVQKNRIDVNKALLNLQNAGLAGQEYYDEAKKVVDSAYAVGSYSQAEYEQLLDTNFFTGYSSMYENMFNDTIDESINRGDSFETIWNMMENQAPNMMKTDGDNMPASFDKKTYDQKIRKTLEQNYNAKLADIQQGNADKLSQIVQQMRQNNTAEGKLAVARQGQMAMNRMRGIQLSETDRLKYSALFELSLGDGLGGSGSGSGSGSSKPTDSYETLIKASPDTAVQLWLDGKNGNLYDVTQVVSDNLVKEWFTGNYKENYDKDYAERNEDYETIYRGKTSTDSLTDVIAKQVAEKFPTAKNYIDNNFKNLIKDINDNPKQYGDATVGQLSLFILDWLGESTSDMTDDDFVNAFKKHVNDCYVESCKYMELNKKGELVKTYDATKAKDIAEAANFLHNKDFVFTYNGQDMWAGQSKEALEAKGGLVDVMKNAVAGTIGADSDNFGYYFQKTKDDKTSVPIITYKGNAYEVNATEDGKGFTVKNLTTGEVMDGVIPNNKAARTEAKQEAKAAEKAASQATATTKKERAQQTQENLTASKTTPKAVEVANVISAEEKDWKWGASTNDDKKIILNQAINKIQKDADKVNKNKMQKSDFKTKYGIDYDEWIKNKEENYRYDLILNSK